MMSYDPSSLNRNKTLLEAIEEVKKFLIANPCYKVFYANTNYLVGTTTYSKTYIDDPDSIAEYDVVFFNNNYYGKVESVGDSTFTIIGTTNFKGDQGTQGDPGTPGANGVSITNVSIDASNHLICTLSDGTSIDAGEIASSTDHTITLLSSSGVLTNEQYAELGYDNSIIKYTINSVPYLFRKESEDATEITFRCIRPHSTDTRIPEFIITKARQGYQYYDSQITISGTSVKSGTATAGQVLTADGDGFSSWQTPSGGSFDNYVEINTTSGTFTDDEYAKLGFNDSVIVYDNGSYKIIYKKKIETTSIIEFESIDASARQNLKLIDVNKGTKAFSSTGISMITSATFDSGAATSGKVLTANGSGGTSWEDAGGGTLNEYTLSLARNDLNAEATRQRIINIVRNAKKVFATLSFYDNGMCHIPLAISQGYGAAYVEMSGSGIYYFGGYKLVSAYIQIRAAAIQIQRVIVLKGVDNPNDQPIVDFSDIPSASSRWEIRYWNETEILS